MSSKGRKTVTANNRFGVLLEYRGVHCIIYPHNEVILGEFPRYSRTKITMPGRINSQSLVINPKEYGLLYYHNDRKFDAKKFSKFHTNDVKAFCKDCELHYTEFINQDKDNQNELLIDIELPPDQVHEKVENKGFNVVYPKW